MNTPQNVVRVSLGDIVSRPEWQVREKLNASLVKQYRTAYSAGAAFPPIELADVRGVLYRLDGWHRCEAQRSLGRTQVEATITKLTVKEAEWRSAQANLTHGAALKPKERRAAFDKFIATGQHKKRGGGIGSYRDMAEAFGGGASYGTIRNWIRDDYPAIFKALAGKHTGAFTPDMVKQAEGPTEEELDLQRFSEALQFVVAQSRGLISPTARKQADAMLRDAHAAITKRLPYKVAPVVVGPITDF
jgi:hypothetical protein